MANPLTAELLWTLPRVGLPTTGGGRIVVPVVTTDPDDDTTVSTLWEVPVDGSEPRRLTTGPASGPALSPDGSKLAFVRAVDDRPQIHLLPLDGGEARPLTDLPLGATAARWLAGGERLLVLAPLLEGHLTVEATAAERDRRAGEKSSARVIDRAVYRYWDRWLDGGEVPHLLLVDPASGEIRDLLPDLDRWLQWDGTGDTLDHVDVSPDGRWLAWVADRSDEPRRELRWSLPLSDLDRGEDHHLTPDLEGRALHPRFSPDGARLVYGRTTDPDFYADRVQLVEHRLDSGATTELACGWDRSPSDWVFDGDQLVVTAEDDARLVVWRVDGDEVTEIARDGTLAGVLVLAPGRYVATRSTLVSPPELVLLEDGGVVGLTSFTDGVDFDRPTVEEVWFTGADGDQVHMWVVTPAAGLEEPAPLVHLIHGGPHGVDGDGWHWRWNAAVFCGTDRRVTPPPPW